MAIRFEESTGLIALETEHSTYQMRVDQYGVLQHLYYGAKINGSTEYLIRYVDRGCGGSIPDTGADRSYVLDSLPREYPGVGTGDFRSSAISVSNAQGAECCDLRYVSHKILDGKYDLPGLPAVHASCQEAQTLRILLKDQITGLQVELLYGVLEKGDIITRSAVIRNEGIETLAVEKAASACLDFLYGDFDLISFYGTHAMERQVQRQQIGHGSYTIGSRRGVSSHQYNPAVIIAESGCTEEAGGCYGLAFAWSGSFLCEAEKDQHGQTRVLMGLQNDRFRYPLAPGKTLVVPETILSYSECGLTSLSHNFHRCMLDHVCHGRFIRGKRPVLINSWEASYFDFDGETIYHLARNASELGIDMVVLDDGWFGHRNDDNSSLGDWFVNEEKLGCSLGELIERINNLGVKFGIWVEPEMISEDSELYRAHPEYVLQIPGRAPVRSRNQLVLDFSQEEVREHVFQQICTVLDQGNVEYLKWDMNRSLEDLYDGKVSYDYVLGVYDFLEKLMNRYPDMLIEGCCSGGGRFDAGMLYYTPQIWCSDNTDAIDRLRIQYGTSFFYPAATMGAHVSAVPNHQTGRVTDLHTRGVVAMAGTFGYELDPNKLTDKEKEQIKEQVSVFKKHRELICDGKYYRLSNPAINAFCAWQFASVDGSESLLNVVMTQVHGSKEIHYVRLKGLTPGGIYEDVATGIRYNADALMKAGLPLPEMKGDQPSYQQHLRKVAT